MDCELPCRSTSAAGPVAKLLHRARDPVRFCIRGPYLVFEYMQQARRLVLSLSITISPQNLLYTYLTKDPKVYTSVAPLHRRHTLTIPLIQRLHNHPPIPHPNPLLFLVFLPRPTMLQPSLIVPLREILPCMTPPTLRPTQRRHSRLRRARQQIPQLQCLY